ncbi:sensor histidine kinase [Oceanobacillus piezotolerans]|uniref:histidine kinase n=1 Tax=Oceanobacillus piezotolerans TaxID=2448030 RepID=A0A498DAV9_9BACI|nr:HAMP domain-containing sensor histidine kinase [Oceanobacillus piezotolerans]RLL44883.1 sensor histidine kinase [Oceanobacillus piezotolerans]
MKIKYWLIGTYLIVMLLPIAALYLLYVSLSHYDQQQDLKEYLEFQELVTNTETYLQDASLYDIQPEENYQHLRDLTNNNIKIDLYRYDGVQVFSSLDSPGTTHFITDTIENLYKGLNEYKKNPQTHNVKKLMLDEDNRIIGLYEITVGRNAWVDTASNRSLWMIILFSVFFIGLYALVFLLLQRKLNRPLKILQAHMRAFAKGEEAKEALVESKDEIGELASHFVKMKEQIIQTREELANQQKEKEYMVASLSHDLKTPLTVIRTYTEALEDTSLSEKEREEYRAILFQKLDHMKQMIDDLSVYTALQSSGNSIHPVQVNGHEFFDMLFAGYEAPCAKKGIKLVTDLKVNNAYRLDPKQVIRVVDNLMDNSMRYTAINRRIGLAAIGSTKSLPEWIFLSFKEEIEEWRQGGTVLLIQNEGMGIRSEQLEKLFLPFYQDNASRGKGATSGLGLSIAKMIMEKHDGKIKIWSKEEQGTLIACWLKERGY